MNLARRIEYPRYVTGSGYDLLSEVEVVAKWTEAKTKPGIRFGGVGLIRVEGMHSLGYVFVSENSLKVQPCQRYGTVTAIQRVNEDPNHNVKIVVYDYCDEVDLINGNRLECGENIWPVFSNFTLMQLMLNVVVADRPEVVMLH